MCVTATVIIFPILIQYMRPYELWLRIVTCIWMCIVKYITNLSLYISPHNFTLRIHWLSFSLYLVCLSIDVPVHPTRSLQIPIPYSFLFSGLQPASNLQTFNVDKRRVSYTFSASPTSGATYKVTFTPQRDGIPQPKTETFSNAGFRTTSGLIPDVTYRLQVVAVLNGEESSAISVNFTTLPDGETAVAVMC